MSEPRRFKAADAFCFLLVLLAAGGSRAAYMVTCCGSGANMGPLRVQEPARWPNGGDSHEDLKTLISSVKARGFSCLAPFARGEEPTAHVAPGYPYLVGLLSLAIPEEKLLPATRWIQAGLGTLTSVFFFLFARRAFRSLLAGLLAGLLTALDPFAILATGALDDGVLAGFTLAWCLFLASQAGEKGGELASLLLGASLAGLALVRASFLPFSFATLIWFLVRSRVLERGWLCALVAFLGFLTALAPWTVRNARAFNEPLPVVSSAYLHLYIGNNPEATGGPATSSTWLNEQLSRAIKPAEPQPARYARLGPLVLEEVRTNPVGTVRRRLDAFLGFFLGWDYYRGGVLAEEVQTSEEAPVAVTEVRRWAQPALQAWLLGMLALALIGWRWSFAWRWEAFPATLALFFVPLPYILSHAEGLSGPRLPLDGVLLTMAALVLAALPPGSGLFAEREAEAPATAADEGAPPA
jgi:4-amino-4-deoxy-L-arabinose transferase-like glycosyltransferase